MIADSSANGVPGTTHLVPGITLPAAPGSYALILRQPHRETLSVGKLGVLTFPAATYVYAGSAHGPGGIRGRIGHHLRRPARPHWHIDALKGYSHAVAVCFAVTREPLECNWSQALSALPHAIIPTPGIGASDCRNGCGAHLVALPLAISPEDIRPVLVGTAQHEVWCIELITAQGDN